MVTIEILDGDFDKYSFSRSNSILGRMYDNESEFIKVKIPESESSSVCTMIVTHEDEVIDHVTVNNDIEIPVRSNLSKFQNVCIGFSFSRANGYIKNSEMKLFSFLRAQKPDDDFVPVEPQQKLNLDHLIGQGFIKAELEGTMLNFYNINGGIVNSIDIASFFTGGVNSDFAQDDEAKADYIKNKSTKYLVNEGADGTSPYATEQYVQDNGGKIDTITINGDATIIDDKKNVDIKVATKTSELANDGDGTSNFATEDYVAKNGGKIDTITINGEATEIDDKKNVNITMPTKLSELLNDKDFIDTTVTNLINYYSKTEIKNLLDGINTLKTSVVTQLPTADISEQTIYMLSKTDSSSSDYYDEYMYISGKWEMIGTTKVDLSNYYTIAQIDEKLALKVNTTDDRLKTTDKTIVGAINEVYDAIINASGELDDILGV